MKFLAACMIASALTLTLAPYQAATAHPISHNKKEITTSTSSRPKKTVAPKKTTPPKVASNALQDEKPRNGNIVKQIILLLIIGACTVILMGMLAVMLPGKIISAVKETVLGFLEKKFG